MSGVTPMIYKRGETFRYEFNPAIDCAFSIIRFANKSIESGKGQGKIIDISPNGCKLSSKLNIPVENEVTIKIRFKINNELIEAVAVLIWKRMDKHSLYIYGVKFVNTKEIEDLITNELKIFFKSGKK